MKKAISLNHAFGDNIFTRNSISNFFDEINNLKDKEMVLDFKDIRFISRSCADEYLKQKKESKKIFVEVNMSEEVCAMFRNVEKQYKELGLTFSFEVCPTQGLVFA